MERIVLNIPHAVPCTDFSDWTNPENIKAEHDKWTDWFTDMIFVPNVSALRETLGEANTSRVIPVFAKLSRIDLDLERLIGDPMENYGQGIIYTKSKNGLSERTLPIEETVRRTLLFVEHHAKLSTLLQPENAILIDCHSCPNDFSEASNAAGEPVDVCLGFNDDSTRPSDEIIELARWTFSEAGYTVGINTPYSNSLIAHPNRPSLMIELNKRIYMNEKTLEINPSADKVNRVLNELYGEILRT